MCGRYVLVTTPDVFRAIFGYVEQPNFPPRYNIAPTQPIPIVRAMEGQRHYALVRWGFIPAWVKDPKQFALVINARGESVNEKPAFRYAIKRRRCLIPADGFYEWKAAVENKGKQPYFIRARSGKPLAFAGLWETWVGPNGEELDTAAIVTTGANETLRGIHHRMPVVIAPDAFSVWLGEGQVEGREDLDAAMSLIAPAPDNLLEAYPVSTDVNRVANDDPHLIEKIVVADQPVESSQPKRRKTKTSKPPKPKKPDENDDQGVLF